MDTPLKAIDGDAGKDSTRRKHCSFEFCPESVRVRSSESKYGALLVKREGITKFTLHSARFLC